MHIQNIHETAISTFQAAVAEAAARCATASGSRPRRPGESSWRTLKQKQKRGEHAEKTCLRTLFTIFDPQKVSLGNEWNERNERKTSPKWWKKIKYKNENEKKEHEPNIWNKDERNMWKID